VDIRKTALNQEKGSMNKAGIDAFKTVSVSKGSYLFRESDRSRDLYIIQSGQIRVFKSEGGIDIELDLAGPGAVVGEISAIDGGTRSASVVALTNVEAICIPFVEFERVTGRLPDWFQKIAKILVQRLREADGRIDLARGGDRTAQVAALISLLTHTGHGTKQEGALSFGETFLENEIMDLLNMQIAEVVDSTDALEKMGILKRERGRIAVCDLRKLEEFGARIYQAGEETPAL
jgi:CRP/FNR family transcriptional regulator, cyclic AMP receptor protein